MKTPRPTAQRQGLPVPIETALLASEAKMAKRSQHRESEGQDGRSERPARWHGQPRHISRDLAT
jgi:hypothetical protein